MPGAIAKIEAALSAAFLALRLIRTVRLKLAEFRGFGNPVFFLIAELRQFFVGDLGLFESFFGGFKNVYDGQWLILFRNLHISVHSLIDRR